MAVLNTKLFIHKNWIKSRGTAAVTQAVTCEPVANLPPTIRSQFFQCLDCIFLGLVTYHGYFRPLCQNRVHEKYARAHGHVKSIPVVHASNSAHSGKQMHG